MHVQRMLVKRKDNEQEFQEDIKDFIAVNLYRQRKLRQTRDFQSGILMNMINSLTSLQGAVASLVHQHRQLWQRAYADPAELPAQEVHQQNPAVYQRQF